MQYRMRTDTQSVEESGQALAEALNAWLTGYGPSAIYKNCENCVHMAEGNVPAFCSKYQMTPPASVIVAGCPAHQDKEEIPF